MLARKGGRKPNTRKNSGNLIDELVDVVDPRRDKESKAARVSRGFHGRDVQNVTEVIEQLEYDTNLAELGELREIEIADEGLRYTVSVEFSKSASAKVSLCCTADREQLVLVGGDQSINYKEVINQLKGGEQKKHLVDLGVGHTITYWTDKHHLEGPRYQEDGCEYIHEFGEEGGEKPRIIYDTQNAKILIVGGSYDVRDEGIWD